MDLDVSAQRLVLAVCVLVTVVILAVDAVLMKCIGTHWTISAACQYMFDRWPVTYTLFVAWVCILLGHLMPAK